MNIRLGNSFTLVEMLVVIAVISVLMTILLPALNKAKNIALSGACMSNLRQCGIGLAAYASDSDDWVIGAECTNKTPYNTLSELLMATNCAPRIGKYHPTWSVGMSHVPNGQVYSCPALPPPASYKMWGTVFPDQNYPGTSRMSYGLRGSNAKGYYAGEKVAGGSLKGLIKYSTLYKPSRLPYMVDTASASWSATGTGSGGQIQWDNWYMDGGPWGPFGYTGALHLRHNRRSNVWFPDGHVAGWRASDTNEFKCPWEGAEQPAWPIGFTY